MTTASNQIRCFIVDDDIDDQELFEAAMNRTSLINHYCVFAKDGIEALEKLQTDILPDYIFLDLNMPRLNGMDCLQEIRKQQHLQHIPVIKYTTSKDTFINAQALRYGATAFISKPTRFNDLAESLIEFFITHQPVHGK